MDINVIVNNLKNCFVNNVIENIESYFKIYDLSITVNFEWLCEESLNLTLYCNDTDDKFTILNYFDDECIVTFHYDERDDENFKNLNDTLQFLVNYLKNEED